MTHESLFGETIEHPTEKPVAAGPVTHRMLITVKAAPNPSATHGETVCVAGIRLKETGPKDWIRLYPINFRHLPEASERFKKYDIVTVEARPAGEARLESWRPNMATLQVETHLPPWKKRRQLVDPMIDDSMCKIRIEAAADPRARSLALVRPAEILGFRLEPHPGWSKDEQGKIDAYVDQLELDVFEVARDKTPLDAPRFKGYYKWRCGEASCPPTSSPSSTGSSSPCSATCGTVPSPTPQLRSLPGSTSSSAPLRTRSRSTSATRQSDRRRSASSGCITPTRTPRPPTWQ